MLLLAHQMLRYHRVDLVYHFVGRLLLQPPLDGICIRLEEITDLLQVIRLLLLLALIARSVHVCRHVPLIKRLREQ